MSTYDGRGAMAGTMGKITVDNLDDAQQKLDHVYSTLLAYADKDNPLGRELSTVEREKAQAAAEHLWEVMGEVRAVRHSVWEWLYWEFWSLSGKMARK